MSSKIDNYNQCPIAIISTMKSIWIIVYKKYANYNFHKIYRHQKRKWRNFIYKTTAGVYRVNLHIIDSHGTKRSFGKGLGFVYGQHYNTCYFTIEFYFLNLYCSVFSFKFFKWHYFSIANPNPFFCRPLIYFYHRASLQTGLIYNCGKYQKYIRKENHPYSLLCREPCLHYCVSHK